MNYAVTADMYSVIGYHGVDYGFPGIAYNIENNQNFDFVYIRYESQFFRTDFVWIRSIGLPRQFLQNIQSF